MTANQLNNTQSTCRTDAEHLHRYIKDLNSAIRLPCSVDRFLQTPFLSDAETENWKVKGLRPIYLLIQNILYAITGSFHAQLSAPQMVASGPNSLNSREMRLPPSPVVDVRILELYRNLFAMCYSSKRAIEDIATSSHVPASVSTPSGTDYASTEQEAAGSSSLFQGSDPSIDTMPPAVLASYAPSTYFSTDSITLASQLSFDSQAASELESVQAVCDPVHMNFKSGGRPCASTPLPASAPYHTLRTISAANYGTQPLPRSLDCVPITLLPVLVDKPFQSFSSLSNSTITLAQPSPSLQFRQNGTPSTVPMKRHPRACTAASPSSRLSSSTTVRPTRGGKETVVWTKEEDQLLELAVGMFNGKNWRKIADFIYVNGSNLPRRTPDQCNQRWLRTIDPKITKGNWPAEEDRQLIAAVKACPSRNWKAISTLMPNRTDVQIRGRLQRLAPMLLEKGILTVDQLPPCPRIRCV